VVTEGAAGAIPATDLKAADDYSARKVERRGIDKIPASERHASPRDLLFIWAAAVFNFAYVVYGAFVVYIGLSFTQAILVILVGHLSYLLVGFYSLQGPKAGTAAFVINRAPFGLNGGRGISWFNWVTVVGYEIITSLIAVLAGLALFAKMGVGSSTGLKIALILAVICGQTLLPFFGHAAVAKFLRLLIAPFTVLLVILSVLLVQKIDVSKLDQSASWENITIALALVFAVAGLGWANMANDYSRYLPEGTPPRKIVTYVTLGAAVPSFVLMVLGAGIATTVSSATDPVSGLSTTFASWFVVPYLLAIIAQTVPTNALNLYSSGLTLQAAGLPVRRYQAVLIDSTICLGLTTAIIFSNGFNTLVHNFLLFTILWLSAWAGVFGVDVLLRRNRYEGEALLNANNRSFGAIGGFNVAGVVALGLGILASAMWIDTSVYVGPLSKATGGSDFSAEIGFAVAAIAYAALKRFESSRQRAGREAYGQA
jgi:NCS1 family nucleobase:cation symporter-1